MAVRSSVVTCGSFVPHTKVKDMVWSECGVDRQVEIVGKGAAPEEEAIDGRAAQQGPSACGGGTL